MEMQNQNRNNRDAIHAELEQGSDLLVLVGQIANMINKEINRVKQLNTAK